MAELTWKCSWSNSQIARTNLANDTVTENVLQKCSNFSSIYEQISTNNKHHYNAATEMKSVDLMEKIKSICF